MWMPNGRMRLVLLTVVVARGPGAGGTAAEGQVSEEVRDASLCPGPPESVQGARFDTTALVYGVVPADHPADGDRTVYAHGLALNADRAVEEGIVERHGPAPRASRVVPMAGVLDILLERRAIPAYVKIPQ